MLQDVDAGEAGYLLTHDTADLNLFRTARSQAPQLVNSLAAETADNPVQVAATGSLKTLVDMGGSRADAAVASGRADADFSGG